MALIAVFALFFALTACSGITNINPERLKIDKAYNFTANIQHSDFAVTASFERSAANVWEITISEPFALAGMVFSYNNGTTSATFEGLTAPNASGDSAVYEQIITAFEHAVNGQGRQAISTGEEIRVSSNLYELVFDKASLMPMSLSIPSAAISAEFSGVSAAQIVPVLNPQGVGEQPPQTNIGIQGLIPHDF